MNETTEIRARETADAADALMIEYDEIHVAACRDLDCYRCYDFIAGPSERRFR